MKPKDKAIEMHDAYYGIFNSIGYDNNPNKFAKQCAIIAVNEILQYSKPLEHIHHVNGDVYWQAVKEEIIKL